MDAATRILPAEVEAGPLTVRCWRESDVADLAEAIAASIEHLRPSMPWIAQEPLPDDARLVLVREWEEARLDGGDAVYGIWRAGRVLGGTGAHLRIAPDGLEIGYWLRADEEGRGTMTHVVRALTTTLLALPGITHLEIHHDEANVRSGAVPPRCGYRLVGRRARTPQAPAESGWGLIWRIGADPHAAH